MKKLLTLIAFVGMAKACWVGYVYGLNPYGDNFLAVRTGPSTSYRQVDALHNGDRVFICNRVNSWYRIFYGRGCYLRDGYPVGNCYSGWVFSRYID